jgi:histone-lysine N-methyltransferase MLL3
VLYANQNHPELKMEYPQWSDRYKQILKKWRALPADKKAPYLQRARDNRSAQQAQLRTKKAQQVCRFYRLLFSVSISSNVVKRKILYF